MGLQGDNTKFLWMIFSLFYVEFIIIYYIQYNPQNRGGMLSSLSSLRREKTLYSVLVIGP